MTDTPAEIAQSAARTKQAGMLAMALAMFMLPVGDAVSKALTDLAAPYDVAVWRTTAQAGFFIPVAIFLRRRLRGPLLSPAALLSGALLMTVFFSLVTAFEKMPIANAIAIFFIEPLLLTLLSGPFLGEKAGPRRYAAVAVGLIGALIVLRPNFAAYGPVALMPVVAALAYACNMIVLRKATRVRSPLTFQIGATFCAAGLLLAGLGLGALFGRTPAPLFTAPGWVLWAVLGAGALAALTFLLITVAFSRAEASLLAPFQYLEIAGATVVGYLVFGDFPDAITWLGTAIILASGIYVFHRERKADAEIVAAASAHAER